jgi:hypothetical protein
MPSGDRSVGTVCDLARYPLKSAAGEHLTVVDVADSGLVDDRRWVLEVAGEPLTAKEYPPLRRLPARSVEGRLEVDAGAGWGDVGSGALDGAVGARVRVRDEPGANQQAAPVHVVSVGAETGPGVEGCDPVVRANIVLDRIEPGAERTWIGRRVRIGGAELLITALPKNCLGVYAGVVRAGTVRLGDPVLLVEEDSPGEPFPRQPVQPRAAAIRFTAPAD